MWGKEHAQGARSTAENSTHTAGGNMPMETAHTADMDDTTFETKLEARDLFYEAAILKRLVYKNSNQHRSSSSFRKVLHIPRIMGRITRLQLVPRVAQLNPTIKNMKNAPTQEKLDWLVLFIADLHNMERLLVLLRDTCKRAHLGFQGYLEKTYFMSVSLVIMAGTSRLRELCLALLADIRQYKLHVAKEIWPLLDENKSTNAVKDPQSLTLDTLNEVDFTIKGVSLSESLHVTKDAAVEDSDINMDSGLPTAITGRKRVFSHSDDDSSESEVEEASIDSSEDTERVSTNQESDSSSNSTSESGSSSDSSNSSDTSSSSDSSSGASSSSESESESSSSESESSDSEPDTNPTHSSKKKIPINDTQGTKGKNNASHDTSTKKGPLKKKSKKSADKKDDAPKQVVQKSSSSLSDSFW